MALSLETPLLDVAAVRDYRRQGFLKLPPLLDGEELDSAREFCRATEGEKPHGLAGQEASDPGVVDRFAYHRHDKYRAMWSNVFDLRLRSAVMMGFVNRWAAIARQLVGEDVRVFWDKTFVKPPASDGTRESVWHQDFPYNPIDRRGMLTIWIALEDVPADAGALRFVPGSHRLGPLGRHDLVSREYEVSDLLREDDLELVGEPVTVPLSAGEATVHDALTLHGAGPNLSDRPRRAWTVVYLPASTRYTGGPHPQEGVNSAGLVTFEPFDQPRFRVSDVG